MSEIKIPRTAREILKRDQVLGHLIEDLTLNFPPSRGNVYEDMIEAIVYQQISIKAAKSIFEKFCAYFGGIVPAKEDLADVSIPELRSLGLSNQKAAYVRNIAAYFIDCKLTDAQLHKMEDEDIVRLLTEIKGVGVWTVQMILIFSMVRPDVFPVKDYGIQTAMQELYSIKSDRTRDLIDQMQHIAQSWKPWSTYGTLLLWAWKRKQMNL